MRRLLGALGVAAVCAWAWAWGVPVQAQAVVPPAALAFAAAQTTGVVTASWTANPATDLVVVYRLYYGLAPATYTLGPIDVAAPATSVVVPNLTPGVTYYFALQARAATLVSPLSPEVAYTVPVTTPDPCAFPLGASTLQIFPTALQLTGSGGAGSKARLDFQVGSSLPVIALAVQSAGVTLDGGAIAGISLNGIAGAWFTVPSASGTYPLSLQASNAVCTRTQATSFSLQVP